MWVAVGIIIALVAASSYFYYKMDLMRGYYQYMNQECKTLEDKVKTERQEKEQLENKLNQIAYTNPMSKIHNFDYFMEFAKQRLEQSIDQQYALITISIANIGEINRIFGTKEADHVIQYVAQIVKKEAHGDIYGHIQSNVFGILKENGRNQEVTEYIEELSNCLTQYEENIKIEPNFGIYFIKDKEIAVQDMVNYSILAQKSIKDRNECNYNYYTEELESKFIENKKLSEEMEKALEDHKFLMYLQPIVDLRSFQIISCEALVRWEHKERGVLSPYAFLPIFESNSMVKKLDYYMWEECCKTIRRWMDNHIKPTPISMNISPIHFLDLKFIDQLNELTEKYLISRDLIILELPERGLIHTSIDIKEVVNQLKTNGFRMCIDNFGSMHSPLNLLKDIPIEMVKIDRKFLLQNATTEEGIVVLKYLIAMAKDIGLSVITEGVETIEQANFLAEIGSDAAQGYFFSKPVDLRTFDVLNKSMVGKVYPVNEFYPTFADFEKDLNLLDRIINGTTIMK